MTNLQKIQQETEEIFFNKYPVGMETIDFIHSRESIAYKVGYDEGMSDEVENCPHTKSYKAGLEGVRNEVERMKCECPNRPKPQKELTDLFVDSSLKYVGRFNYNKSIDDVLTLIDEELKK